MWSTLAKVYVLVHVWLQRAKGVFRWILLQLHALERICQPVNLKLAMMLCLSHPVHAGFGICLYHKVTLGSNLVGEKLISEYNVLQIRRITIALKPVTADSVDPPSLWKQGMFKLTI